VGTYLDTILADHRAEAASDQRALDQLIEEANAQPATRGFANGLVDGAARGIAVIAEVKRRSPSKGDLFAGLDPVTLAQQYAAGGASAMSVLTDAHYFGGSADDLRAARNACELPVIRKDFTIAGADVCDARIMGADAVLLIAAALDDAELADFHALATELGLDALVEIHDEAELERAHAVNATVIGVNQRDLVTFEVDTDRARRMAPLIGDGAVRIAESGVRGPEDAKVLAEAGFAAVLVGESLVTSGDPTEAVKALITAPNT